MKKGTGSCHFPNSAVAQRLSSSLPGKVSRPDWAVYQALAARSY
jgi:hypothetical protein